MIRNVVMITCTLLLGGCFVYVRTPAIRGRVIDEAGQPIGNATVVVAVKDASQPDETITVASDGTFSAPEQSDVALRPIFGDLAFWPMNVTAIVRGDPERRSAPTIVHGGDRELWEKPIEVDVGDLRVP
jgi:hypothetical protein